MNCFDWQNRSSDYLDGALIGPVKKEADEHLESCESCTKRHKHYRLVLTSIASQPRTSLPVNIRKAPLSATLPRGRQTRMAERLRIWSNAPWYVRVPAEGAGIVLLISLAISVGPGLRNLYERKVERSLTEYNDGLSGGETDPASSTKLSRGNVQAAADPIAETGSAEGDDFATEGTEGDDAPAEIKVGNSETWRFNLKTDSPLEVRTKIVQILTDLGVPASAPGVGGVEAPGGIQFDLVVSQAIIPNLKQALEKIAPAPPKDLADSPFGETFTWYKKKSKNALPAGQTHVVIWLAQI